MTKHGGRLGPKGRAGTCPTNLLDTASGVRRRASWGVKTDIAEAATSVLRELGRSDAVVLTCSALATSVEGLEQAMTVKASIELWSLMRLCDPGRLRCTAG